MSIYSSSYEDPYRSPYQSITQAGAGGQSIDSAIRALFANGEQGAWYDPSDFSTMFQDAAGATPVTAVEQPVGLALDGRLGLVRGPELVTNGAFDSGAGWVLTAGVTISGGKLNFAGVAANNPNAYIPLSSYASGDVYEITFTISGYVAGGVQARLYSSGETGPTYSANGTYTHILRVGTSNGNLGFCTVGASTTLSIDNVSCKKVPGNHASQPTTAQKPVLKESGAYSYLNLDRVDDNMTAAAGGGGTTGILVCAAIRAGGAGNARTIWSDRGANTGYCFSVNASNQLVLSAGNGSAHTEVIGPTITAGTDYVVTGWHDGTNLNVRVNAGATTSAAFGTATAGTAGFTIGKDNGAASGYYGERIYEIVYRKNDTSSTDDRTSLITYMAAQAGISL